MRRGAGGPEAREVRESSLRCVAGLLARARADAADLLDVGDHADSNHHQMAARVLDNLDEALRLVQPHTGR
jgi:hypothetical protein